MSNEPLTPLARAAAVWADTLSETVDRLSGQFLAAARNLDDSDNYTANQAVVDVNAIVTAASVSGAQILLTALDAIGEVSEPLITGVERDFDVEIDVPVARLRLKGDITGSFHTIPSSHVSFQPPVITGSRTVTVIVSPVPFPDVYRFTIEFFDAGTLVGHQDVVSTFA